MIVGLLVAVTLLGAGCSPAVAQLVTTPTPPATATAAPTPTPSPTFTSTATFTPTPLPTATPTPIPTPTPPPPDIALSVPAAPVVQGRVANIRITASRPVTATAFLDSQPLILTEAGTGKYWAPLGVHALAEAGPREVLIQVTDERGREVHRRATFEVVDGEYTTENIVLSPEVAALLDPELLEAERERLQNLWAEFTPQKLWDGTWALPGGERITSAFGTRRSYNGGPATGYHAGQDFLAETGVPVMASAAGVVALAEPLTVRGNTVWIDHGLGVYSGYFHLSEISVEVGQAVKPGDVLGRAGSTGLSTGSHIHWEVRVNGVAVDPLEWTEREIGPRKDSRPHDDNRGLKQ